MNKVKVFAFAALGLGAITFGCQPADDGGEEPVGGSGGDAPMGGSMTTGGRTGGRAGTAGSSGGATGGNTAGSTGGGGSGMTGGSTGGGGMAGGSTGGGGMTGGTGGRAGSGGGGMAGGAGGGGGSNAMNCPATGSFLPFKVGNKWTYRVIDPFATPGAPPDMKETTIEAMEVVPDWAHTAYRKMPAFRVVTKKGLNLNDRTVSWQNVMNGRVIRFAEESYQAGTTNWDVRDWWNPAKLRTDDAKFAMMGMFNEPYQEFKQQVGMTAAPPQMHTDTWTVARVNVSITVPAGTFSTVEIKKSGGPMDNGKTYYYARCVGKVKEVGRTINGTKSGQDEELTKYELK